MNYVQEMQKVVKGGLTSKVPHAQDVKKMMLLKATEKSGLPLSFETVVGAGTKKIINIMLQSTVWATYMHTHLLLMKKGKLLMVKFI